MPETATSRSRLPKAARAGRPIERRRQANPASVCRPARSYDGRVRVDLPQLAARARPTPAAAAAFARRGVHDEHGPHAVLDERPLDLLAGGEHRQPVDAGRLVGDDADRPYPAVRVAQEGRGHALRGAGRDR